MIDELFFSSKLYTTIKLPKIKLHFLLLTNLYWKIWKQHEQWIFWHFNNELLYEHDSFCIRILILLLAYLYFFQSLWIWNSHTICGAHSYLIHFANNCQPSNILKYVFRRIQFSEWSLLINIKKVATEFIFSQEHDN